MSNRYAASRWHKLDNTANLFPVVANRKTTNVFRLTAVLRDAVDPALLQAALEQTLPYFAAFGVRLRHGLFWSYLETNSAVPVARREEDVPCRYIDPLETGRYLFRVLYYKNRVHLETFHALTDGTGAMRFLKALCYRYCQLAYPQDPALGDTTRYGLSEAGNVEDCYLKYYRPSQGRSFRSPRACTLRGERRLDGDVGVTTALLPVAALKEECARWKVSVGVYLAAALLAAVQEEYLGAAGSRRPVSLFVPVDLRRIFHCDTSLNFFSCIVVTQRFDGRQTSFAELIEQTKRQFAEQLTEDYFAKRLAYTARSETSLFTRVVPLPLKNGILRIVFEQSNKGSTLSFSNLGAVEIESRFSEYITGLRFLLSPTPREPIKCAACACGDTLALTFTSLLEQDRMVRSVVRRMTCACVPVTIESNGDEHEAL